MKKEEADKSWNHLKFA